MLATLHVVDQVAKGLGLFGQVSHRAGGGVHGVHGLLRAVVDVNNGSVDFFAGGRLFFTGSGDGAYLISCGEGIADDFVQGLARLVGKFRGGFYLFKGVLYAANALGCALLDGSNGIAHVVG